MKITQIVTLATLAAAAAIGSACGPGAPLGEISGVSEGMRFSITADSLPPRAQDRITWRITVRDAKTGKPIEGGQGRLWALSRDGHKPWDGFAAAPQLGTYLGVITYVTAGPWQMSVQFRRDSLSPFGRVDWHQDVKAPRPLGVLGG